MPRPNSSTKVPGLTPECHELLIQAQRYLTERKKGLLTVPELEAAWIAFYDLYSSKIRKYAFTCGATEDDIADCVQDVWTELLVRLPAFRLDPKRGKFDTWLFQIVRGKTANLRRSRTRRSLQKSHGNLETAIDYRWRPASTLEEEEIFALAWSQVRNKLSAFNFEVLQMRLMDKRPVAEVALKLGLSHEQVWYRYHRARREAEKIGSGWTRGQCTLSPPVSPSNEKEKNENGQKSAQGKPASSVSRNAGACSRAYQGGNCVDYVFQRLELGRRESNPEWKVEWNCDGAVRPILYIRRSAIVAYAEICGSGDFINNHWPRIVNAAIVAGVSAGIATIIATPTGVLPIFQTEFHKELQSKGAGAFDDIIQVALSARQEANGPWFECKG